MKKVIQQLASDYIKDNNLHNREDIKKGKLTQDRIFLIASEYSKLKDNASDREVIRAYNQFKKELIQQYRILKKYIKFEYTTKNPYKNSNDMFKDIEINKRLKVYTGGEYHCRLKGINKIFRAVHDIFGHYIGHNSFSKQGEYKAYNKHRAMFSRLAGKSLFTESIAQVCYYSINKSYAPQKSILFNNYYMSLV